MDKELNSTLELIKYLDIEEGDRLLELSEGQHLIAPILKSANESINYKIDLCLLNQVMFHSQSISYYDQIFFITTLEHLDVRYDYILIQTIFNELNKEDGIRLIHYLLKFVNKQIYLIIDDETNDSSWVLQDFKDFDLSFFMLSTSHQKLIKIYPTKKNEELTLPPLSEVNQSLSILYVVPHRNLTGGLKMLYEQMKALQKRGHRITVMIRGEYEEATPDWIEDFVPDQEIILKPYESYLKHLKGIDIIFAGFYNQIEELKNNEVPVLYWEQGHEYLYGDVKDKQNEAVIRQSLMHQFNQDIYYATDSTYVHDIVKARFEKESYVLPIFIDTKFYHPMEKESQDLLTVLLVGNPLLPFKGFQKALQVLVNAWNQGYRFKVSWACQVKPVTSPLPFEINYFVNVSQTELASIYRQSDILLSCSLYEGCPMPPLEAMASGVAVIATNCGGIHQYGIHGQNALIANYNTVDELTDYLKELLTNEQYRYQLIENGLQTASSLNYDQGAVLLEKILNQVMNQFNEKKSDVKKVKILFMIGTLLPGGAEKVLLNLVKELDPSFFDITVQTVHDEGVYIEEVKNYAKYKTIFKKTVSSLDEAQQLREFYAYLSTLTHEEFSQVVIDEVYDIEVAFLEDYSTWMIANSPNKKSKKIAWVHTDLITHQGADSFYTDFDEHKQCYEKFDQIVCVSEGVKEAFMKKFDICENVCVKYNPINEQEIKQKAAIPYDKELGEGFKIVSVGRLVAEKGFDRLLVIQNKLKQLGMHSQLIIIGEGNKRQELEEFINQNQLSECVTLVGYTDNPYQIMSQSQLFVCSSYVEGFSLAVLEAMILGLPIVATDCGGPKELLQEGSSGILVENDINALFNGIYQILTNTITYFEVKQHCEQRGSDFSYLKQVEDIQNLLLNITK